MKVVKRIIVGVLIAALASAGIYTGLMHVKKSKVTEVPVTSVSNLMTDWYSETTLDGTITTNVAQNVNMDKDMIIEKIYVSQGDDVKKGDIHTSRLGSSGIREGTFLIAEQLTLK